MQWNPELGTFPEFVLYLLTADRKQDTQHPSQLLSTVTSVHYPTEHRNRPPNVRVVDTWYIHYYTVLLVFWVLSIRRLTVGRTVQLVSSTICAQQLASKIQGPLPFIAHDSTDYLNGLPYQVARCANYHRKKDGGKFSYKHNWDSCINRSRLRGHVTLSFWATIFIHAWCFYASRA